MLLNLSSLVLYCGPAGAAGQIVPIAAAANACIRAIVVGGAAGLDVEIII